jgi:ATP-dependent DNA helicase PIF1
MTIAGRMILEYFDGKGNLSRTRKEASVELSLDVERSLVLIDNGRERLCLPSTVTVRVSEHDRGALTLCCAFPRINLLLSRAFPPAVVLFAACVREGRTPSPQESAELRRAVAAAAQATEEDPFNLAAGVVLATQRKGSEVISKGGAGGGTAGAGEGPALSDEQARVVAAVMGGKSLFFTGSAGTGKSMVLGALKRTLPSSSTAFTATTGVAAVAMGGSTLHSWAGMGGPALTALENGLSQLAPAVAEAEDDGASVASAGSRASSVRALARLPPVLIAELITSVRSRREAVQRWRTTRVLVVDEVSMLDGDAFDVMDAVGRAIRGSPTQPWGGIQLVLTGDFFQLPPVTKGGRVKRYAFQAASWVAAVPVTMQLYRVFRQADPAFAALLNEARWGRVSDASAALLKERWGAVVGGGEVIATRLATHRAEVDAENAEELRRLPGEATTYRSIDSASGGSSTHLSLLDSACPAPRELCLKVGAQVILVKTLDAAVGLVNGARGVVTALTPGPGRAPTVKFVGGVAVVLRPEAWPVMSGGATLAVRRQVPLALAWALSIHKSQGMSLDAVSIDLARCFEHGQAYVALSRARSLLELSLKDAFQARCIRASPIVAAFYTRMAAVEAASSAGGVPAGLRTALPSRAHGASSPPRTLMPPPPAPAAAAPVVALPRPAAPPHVPARPLAAFFRGCKPNPPLSPAASSSSGLRRARSTALCSPLASPAGSPAKGRGTAAETGYSPAEDGAVASVASDGDAARHPLADATARDVARVNAGRSPPSKAAYRPALRSPGRGSPPSRAGWPER